MVTTLIAEGAGESIPLEALALLGHVSGETVTASACPLLQYVERSFSTSSHSFSTSSLSPSLSFSLLRDLFLFHSLPLPLSLPLLLSLFFIPSLFHFLSLFFSPSFSFPPSQSFSLPQHLATRRYFDKSISIYSYLVESNKIFSEKEASSTDRAKGVRKGLMLESHRNRRADLTSKIIPELFHNICNEYRITNDLPALLKFIRKHGPFVEVQEGAIKAPSKRSLRRVTTIN